jgi:hypothetical protein
LVHYNLHCVVEENSDSINTQNAPEQLSLLKPNQIYSFKFLFMPKKEDIGKELEINSISLELGERDTRVLILHWKGDCQDALHKERTTVTSFHRIASADKLNKAESLDWDSIPILSSARYL